MAIDPHHPETVFAGTGGSGVWRSSDGGASWVQASIGLPPEAAVYGLAFDPAQPGVIYAADRLSGVYASLDAGETWVQMNTGLLMRAVNELAISADGQHLYAATEGNGVYRLDLNGTAPQPVNSPPPEPPASSTTPPSTPALPSGEATAPSPPEETGVPPAPAAPAGQTSPRTGWPVVAGGLVVLGVMVLLFARRKK
jgi:hypothetical protein